MSSCSVGQGFDLDAIPSNATDGDEVVYEVGGGATSLRVTPENQQSHDTRPSGDPRLDLAEQAKQRGNQQFLAKNFLDAYDSYTEAIEACPGTSGKALLELKMQHDEAEREKALARQTQDTMRRRRVPPADQAERDASSAKDSTASDDTVYTPEEFQVPTHEFASPLSVYHSNRAACSLHLQQYEDAIQDCDIALLLNPNYTKALIRRMTAYENTQRTEEALRDAKTAMAIEPNNKDVVKHIHRLQKLEDERLEKLKEETLGKLKDLGNNVLGYFGLSLDNFKAEKDPNTGSYSISFQNNQK